MKEGIVRYELPARLTLSTLLLAQNKAGELFTRSALVFAISCTIKLNTTTQCKSVNRIDRFYWRRRCSMCLPPSLSLAGCPNSSYPLIGRRHARLGNGSYRRALLPQCLINADNFIGRQFFPFRLCRLGYGRTHQAAENIYDIVSVLRHRQSAA